MYDEESFEFMLNQIRYMDSEYRDNIDSEDDIESVYISEEEEEESDDEFLRLLEDSRPRVGRSAEESESDSSESGHIAR